jgi:Holliday junction resolvasome RuvABC endonuclease subunit
MSVFVGGVAGVLPPKKRKRDDDNDDDRNKEKKLQKLQKLKEKQIKEDKKTEVKRSIYRLSVTELEKYPCLIGLDMSLNSPGLCLYNQKTKHLQFYFIPQLKREVGLEHKDASITITPLLSRMLDKNEFTSREERFELITSMLLKAIKSTCSTWGYVEKDCFIAIEGYSLKSKSSSSASALFELGGIIRNKIYNQGYTYKEISPTASKMVFTGQGSATKALMYKHWRSEYHMPNLAAIFKMNETNILSRIHEKFSITPIEDQVDSFSLVNCLADLHNLH